MNGLRRFFLALYSLLFIAACGGFIALAWNKDQQLDLEVRDFNLQAFIDATDRYRVVFTALLVPFILLGLLTLVIALATPGGGRGTLRIRQADGGTVEVTASALESLLGDELQRLPEIRKAAAKVRLSGGAVDSDVAVTIEPSAVIAQVTSLITQTTSQVLKDQVGVTNIRRPRIRVSYDEISARPVASGGPQARQPAEQPATPGASTEEQPPRDD